MQFSVIFLLFFFFQDIKCQEVYFHTSNKEIYAFLDEMSSLQLIELNSAVKPYSRLLIANKLAEVQQQKSVLNNRQTEELNFYLKDFNKELKPNKNFDKRLDLFYYKDSLFTFSMNPIGGVKYLDNQNGNILHRWNGIEIIAYVGKYVGIYANLRDNYETDSLSHKNYLDDRTAARYKTLKKGTGYSEVRGGINISWDWGNIGLVKDHFEWGNYYHYPSIISSKIPSISQLKLNMKPAEWFEFNYIHGWLVSGIIDSVNSYEYNNSYGSNTRIVYRKKFISSNMFTFKPFKNFHASIGNSIIYSDMDEHPAYIIPIFLYKSIDHTLNDGLTNVGGQNSQLFIDISSRQIKHLHLYATFFFEDISTTRLWENGHMDYYSVNTGFQIADLKPNTFITFEYFQSYPLVYKHDMPTTTFESNFYNLGHYMQDNSRNYFFEFKFRPVQGLSITAHYLNSIHGLDHTDLGTDRLAVIDLMLDEIDWERKEIGLRANWQIINDFYVFGEYINRNVSGNTQKYSPAFYYGKTNTLSIGANVGF